MKKQATAALFALAGCVMQSTAHAATTYRFDNFLHIHETQWLANGTSVSLAPAEFLIPFGFASPVSITFTYDPDVALTPLDVPPDTDGVHYLENLSAPGALTDFVGTIGDYRFSMTPSVTTNVSVVLIDFYPGTDSETRLGALGSTTAIGPAFSGAFDSRVYTLAQASLSFYSGPDVHALPADLLSVPLGTTPYLQLQLVADDGSSIVSSFYVGQISEVPVPASAWLLGTGLVGLAGLGRRGKK